MSFAKDISRQNQIAGRTVFVASMESEWTEAPNTSPESVDTCTGDQTTIVTATTDSRRIVVSMGTTVMVRLKYDDGITGVTDPIIQVLGIDANNKFYWLVQGLAAKTSTLATDLVNDVEDGTYGYTEIGKTSIFDLQGCRKFIIYTQTALAATGTVTTSTYEYKVL